MDHTLIDELVLPCRLPAKDVLCQITPAMRQAMIFKPWSYRAFVQCSHIDAESRPIHDKDWVEMVTLLLSPHLQLDQNHRAGLLFDLSDKNDVIEIVTRRALIAYVLKRY